MDIKTKYNYNNLVWFIYDNKVCSGRVEEIFTHHTNSIESIRYKVFHYKDTFDECQLFETKEDLIKSL